jgi:hypothetical protein
MAVPYYDLSAPTPISSLTCMVKVERLYCFDWDLFSRGDAVALVETYKTLPGAEDGSTGASPAWFGDDEDVPPFLTATVEPPGLQVFGVLPEADWHAWDARFRAATASLPARKFG